MNIPVKRSAWQCDPKWMRTMFWTHCTHCLWNTASQSLFALTTDPSLLPRIYRTGWRGSVSNQCKFIQAALGNVEGLENIVGHCFPDTWYNERFNGTLQKEVLNAEWFHTTRQAQVAINVWLKQYNQIRPHHALNMRPPVQETLLKKPKINGRI